MKMPSDEEIYEFCKDHYYCDSYGDGEPRELWQPFEYEDESVIEENIQNDVHALKLLLEGGYNGGGKEKPLGKPGGVA